MVVVVDRVVDVDVEVVAKRGRLGRDYLHVYVYDADYDYDYVLQNRERCAAGTRTMHVGSS